MEMDEEKALSYYNSDNQTVTAHTPATLGLCLRDLTTEMFETLDITPYSNPPKLPGVMRSQGNLPLQSAPELMLPTFFSIAYMFMLGTLPGY
ncbi:Elongin-B [Schistosoma japonicum]|uniref:Elongin-B n=1 Tax=Schistosoma japonicum TaxID=6182 RepID=A0A4Z2D967_SCHJA|nr:Elongin-B [Schistosoma japonicum]